MLLGFKYYYICSIEIVECDQLFLKQKLFRYPLDTEFYVTFLTTFSASTINRMNTVIPRFIECQSACWKSVVFSVYSSFLHHSWKWIPHYKLNNLDWGVNHLSNSIHWHQWYSQFLALKMAFGIWIKGGQMQRKNHFQNFKRVAQ